MPAARICSDERMLICNCSSSVLGCCVILQLAGCNLWPAGGDYLKPVAVEGKAVAGRVNYQSGPKETWHLSKAGADIYITARMQESRSIRFSLELNNRRSAPQLSGGSFTVTVGNQPQSIKDFRVEELSNYMRGRLWGGGWYYLHVSFTLQLTEAQVDSLKFGFDFQSPPVAIDGKTYVLPTVTFTPSSGSWIEPLQY